jgi:hypothetical protein
MSGSHAATRMGIAHPLMWPRAPPPGGQGGAPPSVQTPMECPVPGLSGIAAAPSQCPIPGDLPAR